MDETVRTSGVRRGTAGFVVIDRPQIETDAIGPMEKCHVTMTSDGVNVNGPQWTCGRQPGWIRIPDGRIVTDWIQFDVAAERHSLEHVLTASRVIRCVADTTSSDPA